MPNQNDVPVTSGNKTGFERVRVDLAQTSFFEGRDFRTFKELNIPSLGQYVVRADVPINIILHGLVVCIESGTLRMSTHLGGTQGGVFSETLPRVAANNMSIGSYRRGYVGGAYAPVTVLTAGGTHANDGVLLDVLRLKANSNTNFAHSVLETAGSERGIGAGTYYFRLYNENVGDPVIGTMRARWEELP